jgi:hypothetical protein
MTELLVPLALGLLANEFVDVCPWLAQKMLQWAACRFGDTDTSERYAEEWTALLYERPGKLLKLVTALSIVVGATWRMRSLYGVPRSQRRCNDEEERSSRIYLALRFPSSALGLPVLGMTAASWFSGVMPAVVAGLSMVSTLYLAFASRTTCGVPVRGRRDGCQNNGNGIMLGCHIRQHRWYRAKLLGARRWSELPTAYFGSGILALTSVVTVASVASFIWSVSGVVGSL